MILVTDRELVGSVKGKNVWKAVSVEAIAIPKQYNGAALDQLKGERKRKEEKFEI